MNRNTGMNAGQIIGTMNGRQVVGLDIAKHVFQLHTVDMGTGEVINVQLKRAKVIEHFANRQPCLIAIEACGSGHHWARELMALGHTVRLLHAKAVRPFVSGNKTDATDARAIWLAVQSRVLRRIVGPERQARLDELGKAFEGDEACVPGGVQPRT
jgi:transposase